MESITSNVYQKQYKNVKYLPQIFIKNQIELESVTSNVYKNNTKCKVFITNFLSKTIPNYKLIGR